MKKSIIGLILSLVLMVSFIPMKTMAALEIVDSGFCGSSVSYILGSDGILRITGSGKMSNFDTSRIDDGAVDSPFLFLRNKIQTIVIGEGVTSIGNMAFTNCSKLTRVEIPSTLTTIGYKAFWGCKNLEGIWRGDENVLQEYITESELEEERFRVEDDKCGSDARYELYNDGKLIISGSGKVTKKFDIETFKTYFSPISEIEFKDGITEIGSQIFWGCNINKIVLPETIKKIGIGTFIDVFDNGKIVLHGDIDINDIEIGEENKIFSTWNIISEEHSYVKNNDGTYTCKICDKTVAELPKSEPVAEPPVKTIVPEQAKPVNHKSAVSDVNGNKVITTSKGYATITKVKKSSSKTITLNALSTVDDVDYVVTEIGAEAFSETKATGLNISLELNKISVNKNAFKGSNIKKVVVTLSSGATKSQKKAVIKAFKKAGIKKKNMMIL